MTATFQTTYLNVFCWIKIYQFRLRFDRSLFPINNIPALAQIMASRLDGAKPLSEPMMFTLLTHICVTRPEWVNIGIRLGVWHTAFRWTRWALDWVTCRCCYIIYEAWWRHQTGQMKTFSSSLTFCELNLLVVGGFSSHRSLTQLFDVFFGLRLNKSWVNDRDARYLRRHCAHYVVTVMGWPGLGSLWMEWVSFSLVACRLVAPFTNMV